MKYLKYFEQTSAYEAYKNGSEFVLPNVSYAADNNVIYYNPYAEAKSGVIMARYNATEENMLALADTSNVKSLKVNGVEVEFGDMYYFNEVGEYDVEIELIDTTLINGTRYDENENAISNAMFCKRDGWVGACLTSVVIPEGITTIGYDAFESCSGLTAINIPDSVTSIGEYAFYDCTSLPVEDNLRYADTYLIGAVDTTLSTCTIKDGTKWIGTEAFSQCDGLTSIVIPNSVTSIGEYAFESCSGLTAINIPNSVTTIGEYTFYDCSSLTSITIPDSITSIGYCAFRDCSGLTSITIPDSVTTIGEGAFGDCSGLTSVHIGSGVTSIGEWAFWMSSNLKKITCNAPTAPMIYYDTFEGVAENGVLKVPAGSDYSSWMSSNEYYLGNYNWTVEYFIPENAKILEIPFDAEGNARQTEKLFNLIYANLGEENIKNNVYANTSISVKEAIGYDYIRYTRYPEYFSIYDEIIEINAYDDRTSIRLERNVYSYHFSNNSYETLEIPV